MIRCAWRAAGAPALVIILAGRAALGQPPLDRIPSVPPELLTRAVTLASGIGRAHDAIGTQSKTAQAFYDQGLAYLHSYVWIEAARALNQALRADASLAVAHAQLTIAYTELNAPSDARAAMQRAEAMSSAATDHDRVHIRLRRLQMTAEEHAGDESPLRAYRAAIDAALQDLPDDTELLLLRGEAESADPADRGQGSVAGAIPFYARAHAIAPLDAAPVHLLTHAYENTRDFDRALTFGAAYAKAAPAIPHARHMQGHVLLERGRIADAIGAFEAADRTERAYLSQSGVPPEYEWHDEHNLDLLGMCDVYLGRLERGEAVLKDAFEVPTALAVQLFDKRSYPALLTSRGRFDAARAAAARLVTHPTSFGRIAGRIEEARALMTARRLPEAVKAANAALDEMRSSPMAGSLAAGAFAALQGELLVRTGERARGEAMLRDTVKKLRMLTGPDAHMDALFTIERLARGMRDAGDWELADWLAAQLVELDPNYAGSQFASALALEHAGHAEGARQAFAAAVRLWSTADPTLPELQAAKQKLR